MSYTNRIEEAVRQAESASEIARQWANGPENTTVETESGPLPTIAELMRQKASEIDENAANVSAFQAGLASEESTVPVGGVPAGQILYPVLSIKDLASASKIVGKQYYVKGFYGGSAVGGGFFTYDAARSWSDHNGGTVIAVGAIIAWDGTRENLASFLGFSGSGLGCFVKSQDTFDMDDFGFADHDGIFDDGLILRALINSQVIVKAKRKGLKYAIKSACIFNDIPYVNCDFSENEFVSHLTGSFRCIAFISTLTNLSSVESVENNITSIGSKKGVRITLANASNFAVGDHIRLISNDAINPRFAAYEKCGQGFEIVRKDGNQLFLDDNTKLNFTENVRVLKYNKQNVICFFNAKFSHVSKTGVGSVQILFDIVTYSNPIVGNITFQNTSAMGLRFQSTFKAMVKGGVFGDDMPGNTSSNQVGYVLVSSGTRGVFDLVYGRRVRHCYTSTAEDVSNDSTEYEKYGGCVGDKVITTVGIECHSFVADTHSDAVDVLFENVVCESNSQERGEQTGALQFRGRHNYAGKVTQIGNNMAVFYNVGFDLCHVSEIVSIGGQALSVAGVDGTEVGTLGKVTLKVNDDNIYGLRFQNNFKLVTVDEYNVSLENDKISIGTKLLVDILGLPSSSVHIKKMMVETRALKSGTLSAFVPIQVQSEIGTIQIDSYQQFNSESVAANRGMSVFIQGTGGSQKKYHLRLLKAEFYTYATSLSAASPNIKGGSFHSEQSTIDVDYTIFGAGFTYVSSKKRFNVFQAGMIVPHCFYAANASQLPYVQQIGDIETTLTFTTGGTCTLQPPAYVGQKWKIVIPTNAATGTSLTIGSTLISSPSNVIIELECVNSGEWSVNYQK